MRGLVRTTLFAALCAAGSFLAASGRASAQAQGEQASADTALYRVSVQGPVKSNIENGERVVYMEEGVRIDHETTTITSLRGKHYPNKRFIVLSDSVRVLDGSAVMLSDVGEYYGATNTVILSGHVRFTDRGWIVHCDRVRYDRAKRIALLTGHLSLADSARTMHADTIYYDRNRETADAYGRVVLIDTAGDYSIAGRHARYDRSKREAMVDAQPVLTFDLKSAEQGIVTSRTMRFDVDHRIGIARRDVQMIKGETRASCDSAVIYDREGRAELFGEPRASNGTSAMTGKRMLLWYDKHEVNRVVLPESGRLSESPRKGSPWREDSWIVGDSISIFLSKEQVDSVRIFKSAKAMYYPVEGEANKVSNNYSTGNKMFFSFRNKELSYIRIAGESNGLYRFLNLAARETIDSLAARADSTLKFKNFHRANERVQYSADVIEYFADTEEVRLRGHANLKYQNSALEAERIDFSSRLNLLEATGSPVLEESGQRMYGRDMGYDMDSQAGVVVDGSTKYGEGYYEGQDIFKVGKDVLKVYNSTYTTCDLKDPHYSFHANRMKVYINDKIVSGPIWLYVGNMPVFYLPFMVNSLRHERSSGFLRPNFDIGLSSREGRFVRGFGYYWAPSQYTDFLVLSDFNEKNNLRLQLGNKYKVRYLFEGSVRVDAVRDLKANTDQWRIESNHAQTFSPSANFASQLEFVSSDKAQQAIDASQDIERFVDRKIYSSARFSKSWGGASLSISANRDQKLNVTAPTESRVSGTIPSLSLNFPRRSLWFGDTHPSGQRSIWERMLASVMFTPSISGTRTSDEGKAYKLSTFATSYGAGFSQQRTLRFIGIQPSLNMGWNYYKVLQYKVADAYADSIPAPPRRPQERNDFSMSMGSVVSTKFYGTIYPRLGSLVGIHHTITPSLTYDFTPKLNERQRQSQIVAWSLDNTIDLKLKRGAQEVKENNVLTWSLSGTYNPALPRAIAFSDVSSTTRLRLGSLISFNLNNTYSPLDRRIVSTHFSTGLDLRGSFLYPATWSAPKRERVAAAVGEEQKAKSAVPRQEGVPEGAAQEAGSWSFRLNYNVDESVREAQGRLLRTVNSNVDFSSSVKLTQGWSVSYEGYYNIETRSFNQQWYSLDRDLHCWRASFKHRRFGKEWSYYFEIGIKAHPEIKYERGSEALQSYFGGGLPGGLTGGAY